eukprot:132608_1
MGLECSSISKRSNNTNYDRTASNPCPWNNYESKSKLNHSFRVSSTNEHIQIANKDIEQVKIALRVDCNSKKKFNDKFTITAQYINQYLIENLLNDIINKINTKHQTSIKYEDVVLNKYRKSFCTQFVNDVSIILYDKKQIEQYGLYIELVCQPYVHTPHSKVINCPEMMKFDTLNPNFCDIYKNMKFRSHIYTNNELEYNLYHLNKYNHFKDEYLEKEECIHHWICPSFKRQHSNTFNDYSSDKLHLMLYKHPPRKQIQFQMEPNIYPFIHSKLIIHRYHSLYDPLANQKRFDFLSELINELITNGFTELLSFNLEKIMKMVKNKLNCLRHKQMWSPLNMSEMFALVLYVNHNKIAYDFCESQLNGNYSSWKIFDKLLFDAIYKLKDRETGNYELYCVVNNIQMTQTVIKNGIFPTYINTTFKKENVLNIIQDNGIIIEMNKSFRINSICCDVSWISLFPDECQVIIARDIPQFKKYYSLKLKLLNEVNNVQYAVAYYVTH